MILWSFAQTVNKSGLLFIEELIWTQSLTLQYSQRQENKNFYHFWLMITLCSTAESAIL